MALCPALLAMLADSFNDHVAIGNEGEEMLGSVDKDAYTGKLQRQVHHGGEYYRVNCPFCNDTRQRLWISHRWGQRDPETGSLNLHLAICYNESDCLQVLGRSRELYRLVYSQFTHELGEDVLKPAHRAEPARVAHWPGRRVRIDELLPNHPARKYLVERGFDIDFLVTKLGVCLCIEAADEYQLAQSRIIIPILMNGDLKGWQARYVGDPGNKNVPKYYSMPGRKKSELLYNFDSARKYPFVVICEGVTDVWAAGPASVALFGKTMSAMQKMLVGSTWQDGTAVILLDGDAGDDAQKIHAELEGVVRQRVLVRLPGRTDPGELPFHVLEKHVCQAAHDQGVVLTSPTG